MDDIFTDKGAIGIARAKQIEKFFAKLIFRFLASMLNRRHFNIVLAMNSFNDYLRQPKIMTNNQITEANLYNLLHQTIKQNEQQIVYKADEAFLEMRPSFVSLDSWTNFRALETQLAAFENITKSLKDNASKWIEYFHMDTDRNASTDLTEKEIDLLNDTPFELELDLMQKLMLWLTIHPERAADIVHKYNVYNYGGLIGNCVEMDLDMAYKISSPSVPLLITVPKQGRIIF